MTDINTLAREILELIEVLDGAASKSQAYRINTQVGASLRDKTAQLAQRVLVKPARGERIKTIDQFNELADGYEKVMLQDKEEISRLKERINRLEQKIKSLSSQ